MASSEGGMDIEEVAAKTPEKIHKVFIDPVHGPDRRRGRRRRAQDRHSRRRALPQGARALQGALPGFDETDASLAEINPLIVTGDGSVVALDAKLNFDDNALFRHPDIVAMRDLDEEDPAEIEASKFDLNYISLDGDIGCLVNGAGLAMATMDIDQALRRQPGQLPRRRRRRHRGEGDRGVQDHADEPEAEGDPGQHLRRHHEVRHRSPTAWSPRRGRCSLTVPLVVRHEGHQRGSRQEDPRRFRPADHLRGQHGRRGARRSSAAAQEAAIRAAHESSSIDKNTRVITQGITGKTGQFHTRMGREYANGKNCYVAGVNPKKAGEDFEGIPIFATVKEAKEATGATVSVIYVPPPFAAAAIDEAVDAGPRSRHLHHRGHSGARHDPHRDRMQGKRTLLLGPNCPGVITPDEIKIGIMPGHIHKQGPDRRGVALRHAHLRGGRSADASSASASRAASASAATRSTG